MGKDGKVLIILDIFKGEETLYYYSGDGVLEAYVRVGNESVKATATELKRLVISFGLANEQGYLTNAGALVADESPIRWSRLFCTRWNGRNKSVGTKGDKKMVKILFICHGK